MNHAYKEVSVLSPKHEKSAEDTKVTGNIIRCGNCRFLMEDCSFNILFVWEGGCANVYVWLKVEGRGHLCDIPQVPPT